MVSKSPNYVELRIIAMGGLLFGAFPPKHFLSIEEPNVPQSGPYQVEVDYLLRGSRSFFISVNDGPGLELPLQGNSWFSPAQASITLNLKAGRNVIVFYNDRDFAPDLDRIVLR